MRQVILVRHGLRERLDHTALSAAGRAFARRLPALLPGKIDFLASGEELRCVETVRPLAEKHSLRLQIYTKVQFKLAQPLLEAPPQGVSVICYGLMSIKLILGQLGFLELDSDLSYKQILVYTEAKDAVTLSMIPTGQEPPSK